MKTKLQKIWAEESEEEIFPVEKASPSPIVAKNGANSTKDFW